MSSEWVFFGGRIQSEIVSRWRKDKKPPLGRCMAFFLSWALRTTMYVVVALFDYLILAQFFSPNWPGASWQYCRQALGSPTILSASSKKQGDLIITY
jgi:hypothetical protein